MLAPAEAATILYGGFPHQSLLQRVTIVNKSVDPAYAAEVARKWAGKVKFLNDLAK